MIVRQLFALTMLVVSPEVYYEETASVSFEYSSSMYVEQNQIPPPPLDYSECGTDRVDTILDIAEYATAAGFEYKELSTAVSVALAESDGDPEARAVNRNRSTDTGLWQVNSVHGETDLYDPWSNAVAAYRVWLHSGWTAWYAHTPRGGEYGSGKRYKYWKPIVSCVLTLSPDYGTIDHSKIPRGTE